MNTTTLSRSAADVPLPPSAPTRVERPRPPRRLAAAGVARAVGRPRLGAPALLGLLVATAAFYLYNLTASGWANSFYSAAVQAGSANWKAFFFGSSDAGNSITVDKPPASLWVMALSVSSSASARSRSWCPRCSWASRASASLYATVRRHFGAAAGLIAGAVLALTPVAVLMFRFNNPDALLTLLMVLGAWATVRSHREGVAALVHRRRRLHRPRLPHQDPAGVPRRARLRPGLPRRRPAPPCASGSSTPCSAGWPSSCPPAGGSRSSSSCRRACGPTSAARRPTPSSS